VTVLTLDLPGELIDVDLGGDVEIAAPAAEIRELS
jgi:hypothetical protein